MTCPFYITDPKGFGQEGTCGQRVGITETLLPSILRVIQPT